MKRVTIIIALLALLSPAALLAQEELTLEALRDALVSFSELYEERYINLTQRVEILEARLPKLDAPINDQGWCVLGGEGRLHASSLEKYRDKWGEWPDAEDIFIAHLLFNPDENRIGIIYSDLYEDRYIHEFWEGCKFIGSSEWFEK